MKEYEKPVTINTDQAPSYGVAIRELKEEGLLGEPIYEQTIGNVVVEEDELFEAKPVPVLGTNALRSKTSYYSKGSAGTIRLDVLVDVLGNVDIQIPSSAIESGVNIEGMVNDIVLKFANITVGDSASTEINVKGLTINVGEGGNTTSIVVDGNSIKIGETATTVELGSNATKLLCNNLPNCLFTGAAHMLGNTTVKV